MIKENLHSCLRRLSLLGLFFCSFSFASEIAPQAPNLASLQNNVNPPAAPLINMAKAPTLPSVVMTTPPPPALDVKAYVLMDAATGKVLASYNPDLQVPPASLTKMMTSYVISMAIKEGKIRMDEPVLISEKAWRTGGSKMFVKVGTQVPVRDLMQGIIVDSGNDACVAMAEHVAGSEDAFANLMNQTAQALGMRHTFYVDSTGLPDPRHHSSASDLATLARALVYNFPEDYKWYSQKYFTYNNIKQPNRNLLLWRDSSVDGIKTGHTDEAGYCLVSSAQRNGTRLIAVIMGAPTIEARATDSKVLLDYGFHFFETHLVYQPHTMLASVRTWKGKEKLTGIGLEEAFVVTTMPGYFNQISYQLQLPKTLLAPLKKGQEVGKISAVLNGKILDTAPLVVLNDNPEGNILRRSYDSVAKWFNKG